MKTIILYMWLILLPSSVKGQDDLSGTESLLKNLFSRVSAASNDNDKLRVNDSIRMIVAGYASTANAFSHNFTTLRYLGQVTSPDTLLKIISWNLNLENYKGKYFSYILSKGRAGDTNRIIPLVADYHEKKIITDTTLTPSQWYGALYYSVMPVTFMGDTSWIVLGLDYGDPAVTRKIIDVLSFDEKNEIVFGRKWFEKNSGLSSRIVFEYASAGMMTMRFSSDTSIVFDHLVPIPALTNNNRVFYGPDYSYDAYVFENGIWKFKLNVDARNKE